MKKTTVLIFCLAFLSLACLTTSGPYWTPGPETPAPTIGFTPDEVFVITPDPDPTSTAAPRICARVVAIEALNVRIDANEQARILTWLKNNDVVVVVDQVNADWWHIESAVYSGYARSIYLQESECE
jgi:hypothetical protein